MYGRKRKGGKKGKEDINSKLGRKCPKKKAMRKCETQTKVCPRGGRIRIV